MLHAWGSAGVGLPRVSQDQYYATTPISQGELRRGDLLFWGGPHSVYHVAMYLGDGMMIHAPRTGRDVVIESMYYWMPDSYGRL
jgi:cell wall-associated NlpC family hydrolase